MISITAVSEATACSFRSRAAKAAGIDIEAIAGKTEVVESPDERQDGQALLCFSESDKAAVDALPKWLTHEQYVEIVKLLTKLSQSEDFERKQAYLANLTAEKEEVLAIQTEIDKINEEILQKLYPFDKMSLEDKPVIDSIVERYNALSDYDKAKIERWEDVVKTENQGRQPAARHCHFLHIACCSGRNRRGGHPAREVAKTTKTGGTGSACRAV